jgi:hypothetical protein
MAQIIKQSRKVMATNLLHSVCKTLSCGEYNHPAYCVAAVACHFVYNFTLESNIIIPVPCSTQIGFLQSVLMIQLN